MIERALESLAFSSVFGRQMRFIVGPRQTGKTTIAENFLKQRGFSSLYYNWDNREVRNSYRNNPSFFMKDVLPLKKGGEKVWLCFDEVHKMPKWKNILKGIFDTYEDSIQFIITGSARLDMLKYTGESLLGRYFTFKLFPLSLAELNASPHKIDFSTTTPNPVQFIESVLSSNHSNSEALENLLNKSGFPEPFLSDSALFLSKWQSDYIEHYIKEDLRDLTNIHELENVFSLISILPSKVGNPLSLNSLREDLEVSHTAVRTWLKALQLAYVIFTIKPFTKRITRTIKKAEKCYFFDWARIHNEGSRFENYVAVELSSFCSFITCAGLGDYDLYYFKTKDGLETDFLITQRQTPWILFECKLDEENIAAHHINHAKKLGDIPLVQIVKKSGVLKVDGRKCFTASADRFFYNLSVNPTSAQASKKNNFP